MIFLDENKIQLIIFDANQVLYNAKPILSEFGKLFADFLKSHDSKFGIDEAGKIWKKFSKATEIGKMTMDEAKLAYLSELGLQRYYAEYEEIDKEAISKAALMDSNAPSALEKLSRHFKLAVLSDTGRAPKDVEALLYSIGFGHVFDKVFTSSSLHCIKPDPEAYLSVLRYYSIKPENAAFVGHDYEELKGAEQVSIKPIAYIEPYNNYTTITAFSDLLNILH